jgi:hypothetical protein
VCACNGNTGITLALLMPMASSREYIGVVEWLTDPPAQLHRTCSSLLLMDLLRMSSMHSLKQRSTRLLYIFRLRWREDNNNPWRQDDGWLQRA